MKVTQDSSRSYYVGIRLRPGVTPAAADAALNPIIRQFARDTPKHFPKSQFRFHVVGLNEDFVKRLGGTLYLLFGAVAVLLFIGCANVSILLLARGTARQHEFAVRTAIGANRRRLIYQMLTEALLLSLIGSALGVLLAYRATSMISALLPKYSFPHEAAIQLNLPVLAFAVLLALLTGILFGLWPALQLSRPDVGQVMQASTRRVMGGTRGKTMNNILIGGQIALTLIMLVGAGAAMQAFLKLLHTPLGYDPHNVMSIGIPVHDGAYSTWAARATFFEQIRNKVAAVPGVSLAAVSTNATPPSNGWNTSIEILGKAPQDAQKVRVNFVSPEYFPILRVSLDQGRIWDPIENHNAAHVAVVNQTFAHLYFPHRDALGHSLKVTDLRNEPPFNLTSPGDTPPWLQIVGIIADKRDDGLRNPVLPEIFIPYTLSMHMWTQILVRSDTSPLALLHAIGRQVNSIDPDQQISGDVQDLEHWIEGQQEWEQEHLVAWLFGAFAALALALAATGLYSVVSFSVEQRTNEFGIRMALGAQRPDLLRLVFYSVSGSVGGGMLIGALSTIGLSNALAHWVEGSSRDSLILLSAIAVLATVVLLACAGPANRASATDPMAALRYE